MAFKGYLNNLSDWHKGYITLIVGVPVTILVLSVIGEIISGGELGFIITATPLGVVLVFGLISGYIANQEYFKVFLAAIVTLFVLIVILGIIAVLTGSGLLSLDSSGDPVGSIFVAIFMFTILGLFISAIVSIILLPSLFIGAFARKRMMP